MPISKSSTSSADPLDLFGAFDLGPRIRPIRTPSQRFLRRTRAAAAMNGTGRILAEIVGLCGAIPASLAVAVARSVNAVSATSQYAAIQSLRRAGIVMAVPFSDLGMSRAAGLGHVLMPGQNYAARLEEFWTHRSAPMERPNDVRAIATQLLMVGSILRDVAAGGRVLRGTLWLQAAAQVAMPWVRTGRIERLARADVSGLLKFPAGLNPVGLIPAVASEEVLPTIMLGAFGTTLKSLGPVMKSVSWVAPSAVLAPRRSARVAERMRRVVYKEVGSRGECPVRFLPKPRGEGHRRFWREVIDRVHLAGADVNLLVPLVGILPE